MPIGSIALVITCNHRGVKFGRSMSVLLSVRVIGTDILQLNGLCQIMANSHISQMGYGLFRYCHYTAFFLASCPTRVISRNLKLRI